MATGDILVFLNNDTLPRAGWLRALVHTFVNYPDAGAVGAKLLYPDGSLQEAGGIIYRDGSGCNYGRMDPDPDRRRYQHVRRVHYCSGAVLATPRLLFHQLGGFDPQYSPAYYEDSDYCFSVRAAGKSVYYQPNCVVVHLEGVSSGTDLRRGVKRYQVVNQQKFVEKWGKVLAGHPPRPRAHVRVAQRLKRTVVWRRARPNAR